MTVVLVAFHNRTKLAVFVYPCTLHPVSLYTTDITFCRSLESNATIHSVSSPAHTNYELHLDERIFVKFKFQGISQNILAHVTSCFKIK
jgi:hypothetical protein